VLNLALHGVHTHSKGAHGVHIMVKHSEFWLVHTQYEYELYRYSAGRDARRWLCMVEKEYSMEHTYYCMQ
jgi:hypothetical protein